MPDWSRDVVRALAPLGLRPEREREIADELSAHLDDRYSDARGRGIDHDDARTVALAELSNVLVPELRRVESPWMPSEVLGNTHGAGFLDRLRSDARYALRGFRLNPGFSAVALVTLAIGIGACTLMLSAVNAVLLRPLPYREPDRLAVFWGTAPERGLPEVALPQGLAAVYSQRVRSLESFAVSGGTGFILTGTGDAERVTGATVTSDFFRVLGVNPMLGRPFVEGDAQPNAPGTVVALSHALWMRRYGGDTSILGKKIDLNGIPTTVVAVMPAGFDYPNRAAAWSPMTLDPTRFNCWCFDAIGRMRPGVTTDDVRRDIAHITDDFNMERDGSASAKPGGARVVAMTLTERIVGNIERQMLTLLVAVACVLLIACANIANLLLARTAARGRELAVRCCLGASPRRIASQLLTESMLLALGGAALGTGLAVWGTAALRRLPVPQFPRIDEVRVDPTVLALTVLVAIVTGLCCGLVPAWRATRIDLQDAVKTGVKGSRARASRRTSDGFVIAQFALSLLLLVGAGLLLRSYRALSNVDGGFRAENVVIARVQVPYPRYDSAHLVRSIYDRAIERIAAFPGTRAAGLASRVPLGPGNPQDNIEAEGQEEASGVARRVANIRMVTPGYFSAIGTPLLRGRVFNSGDVGGAQRVVVVDESLAQFFWKDENPIGKRIKHGGDTSSNRWMTVIGVVKSVKHGSLDEAGDLQVYEAFAQQTTWNNYLVVRSDADAGVVVSEMRRAMHAIDPAIPVYETGSMRESVARSLSTRRVTSTVLAGFAATALLLAAIGIYGVMALSVNGRVREFGIRLALGARPASVRALVLKQATRIAAIGVAIGLAGALATTRYLRSMLFGVDALDAVTFGTVALVLSATAVGASYLPARRATRADPLTALREE